MWTGFVAHDALITVKWFWRIITEELGGGRPWDWTRLALLSSSFLSWLVYGVGLEVQFLPNPHRYPSPSPPTVKRRSALRDPVSCRQRLLLVCLDLSS